MRKKSLGMVSMSMPYRGYGAGENSLNSTHSTWFKICHFYWEFISIEIYYGQTKRSIDTRFKEHSNYIRKNDCRPSALAKCIQRTEVFNFYFKFWKTINSVVTKVSRLQQLSYWECTVHSAHRLQTNHFKQIVQSASKKLKKTDRVVQNILETMDFIQKSMRTFSFHQAIKNRYRIFLK